MSEIIKTGENLDSAMNWLADQADAKKIAKQGDGSEAIAMHAKTDNKEWPNLPEDEVQRRIGAHKAMEEKALFDGLADAMESPKPDPMNFDIDIEDVDKGDEGDEDVELKEAV